jgi:hypothetical protein
MLQTLFRCFSGLLEINNLLWRVSSALTKADIAEKIATECGFIKHEASEIVDKLLETRKNRLIAGEDGMI